MDFTIYLVGKPLYKYKTNLQSKTFIRANKQSKGPMNYWYADSSVRRFNRGEANHLKLILICNEVSSGPQQDESNKDKVL
jgi:hypothetical protein